MSLTLTGLISAWRRGEVFSVILAKPLSDCVTVHCLGQCKSRHSEVCGILKRVCNFQTNWISYILTGTFVVCAVGDAGSTCCCFELLLLSAPYLIAEQPLQRKSKSAFASKKSSLIQTMISFIFVEIYAPDVTFPVLWVKRERNLLRVCTWKFV